jgi:hypothetical protein
MITFVSCVQSPSCSRLSLFLSLSLSHSLSPHSHVHVSLPSLSLFHTHLSQTGGAASEMEVPELRLLAENLHGSAEVCV